MGLRLLLLTLFVWCSGVLGTTLYSIPALILIIYLAIQIKKGTFSNELQTAYCSFQSFSNSLKNYWIYVVIFVHFILWLSIYGLRYYSFELGTWDAGVHSNILFNISNGEFFSSFLNVHNFGDHFTPVFTSIALLYKIYPSIMWMMGTKAFAYSISILFIYKLVRLEIKNQHSNALAIVTILLWSFFYNPIITSYSYEFQASALAPPFILLAIYCFQKGNKALFWIAMIVLLGLKEHLGSVWIGFGFYLLLNHPKKNWIEGGILICGGIIAIYTTLFHIMPFYREYASSWSGVERINPFVDIDKKAVYLIEILFPLCFLPLIFWKKGILAGPAIGINLISGMAAMYNVRYHHNDVAGTLLLIAVIFSFNAIPFQKIKSFFKAGKLKHTILLLLLFIYLYNLPQSALRLLYRAFPPNNIGTLYQELETAKKLTQKDRVAVSDTLGAHFYKKDIEVIVQYPNTKCSDQFRSQRTVNEELPKYLIISRDLEDSQIKDPPSCISSIEASVCFQPVKGFKRLAVFELNSANKNCYFK